MTHPTIGTVAMGDTEARKQIEEAIAAQWGDRCPDFDAGCACCQTWAEYDRVTAALSTRPAQEPVAAYTIDFTGCDHMSRDITNIERIAAAGSKGATEVVYLYRGPAAPQPVLSQPEVKACPGADDPEERCPRHPSECTCWQVDNDHPSRKAALCPLSDIPAQAGEAPLIEWPVGEAEVVIFDPRRDPIPRREPYKIIDASLWFMDRAEIGERLYTKAQVEEIVRAATASEGSTDA